MKIDRNLNLVLPVDRGDGTTLYIHSMPIARETFESNYNLISTTFADLMKLGPVSAITAGPRIAHLAMKKAGRKTDLYEGTEDSAGALLSEIRRLTNVALQSDKGWTTVTFQSAINERMLDEDELSEVEGSIVFFIVVSAMMKRDARMEILIQAGRLWDMRIESLTLSGLVDSLPKSTVTVTSGQPIATTDGQEPKQLSVPS